MQKPFSPCKNICKMAEGKDFCEGCGRTLREISKWSDFTDTWRITVSQWAKDRLRSYEEAKQK